ncbi:MULTISPECIES: hypothetical protein [Mumia]|uniref:Uncharacterized protein n=1 Tax=Mumia xiangluensis TaxID=1678900 RepID=A0ABW1QL72_9ACTN|nr:MULTISPECIES: hypothetical protein [Mumia]
MSTPVVAGAVSTVIFAISTLPMLVKAGRTKDLSSYSLGNLGLSNVGNAVHSVYVLSLPAGPLWVLHGFYVGVALLMLVWYLRYETRSGRHGTQERRAAPWGAARLDVRGTAAVSPRQQRRTGDPVSG